MSKLKRGYQAGVGNIRAEEAYDPFPKTGLVKQYEPFIRDYVRKFRKRRVWRAFLVRPGALLTTTELVRLVYPRIRLPLAAEIVEQRGS